MRNTLSIACWKRSYGGSRKLDICGSELIQWKSIIPSSVGPPWCVSGESLAMRKTVTLAISLSLVFFAVITAVAVWMGTEWSDSANVDRPRATGDTVEEYHSVFGRSALVCFGRVARNAQDRHARYFAFIGVLCRNHRCGCLDGHGVVRLGKRRSAACNGSFDFQQRYCTDYIRALREVPSSGRIGALQLDQLSSGEETRRANCYRHTKSIHAALAAGTGTASVYWRGTIARGPDRHDQPLGQIRGRRRCPIALAALSEVRRRLATW